MKSKPTNKTTTSKRAGPSKGNKLKVSSESIGKKSIIDDKEEETVAANESSKSDKHACYNKDDKKIKLFKNY